MNIRTETVVGMFMLTALIVFLFMSFNIGLWRVDTVRYAQYTICFHDVSGLNEKSEVIIAGVKVGWVQKLTLINRGKSVRVDFMIDRNSLLYANGTATIKQNGLLGTKYVEITPGDSSFPTLPPGSMLLPPQKSAASLDEILSKFQDIADNVTSVTSALNKMLSGEEEGGSGFKTVIAETRDAFVSIKKVAETTNRLIEDNGNKVNGIVDTIAITVNELKERLPKTVDDFNENSKVVVAEVHQAVESITTTMAPIKSVATTFKEGNGILNTLIGDEGLAHELKSTMTGIKEYFSYIDRIAIDVDTHIESMQGLGNDLDFKDAKGYFNFLIRPSDNFYYLVGAASSYAGNIKRFRVDRTWFNQEKHEILPNETDLPGWAKLQYAPVKEKYVRDYSALMINAQFAKEFGRVCCRMGLFESTFGVGLDYEVPLSEETKWIMSVELFRFNEFMSQTLGGRMVFDIDLPHVKWYNKVFVNDSIYLMFGADDIISEFNKNFFFGMGLSFAQDDLKYIAPKVNFS